MLKLGAACSDKIVCLAYFAPALSTAPGRKRLPRRRYCSRSGGREPRGLSRDRFSLAGSRSSERTDNVRALRLLSAYHDRGDRRALERLFEEHGRILSHVARKYARVSGESYEDLLQVGYVGLIKAVHNYRSGLEAHFSSYAYSMIDGELRHHFRDAGLLRRPRWARSLYARVSEATARLTAELERPPLPEEVAREVNVTTEGVVELLKLFADTEVSSLDGDGSETADLSAIKSLQHESFTLPLEDRILLEESLKSLTELQRKVVYLFFYKDLSQTEIGRRLGLPQRKVSRIIAASVKSLKERISSRD